MSFDSALFHSTAYYYARYRPGYPGAFLRYLVERYGLDGTGRLLDLGCGTGQFAMQLAPYFHEVVAVDADAEMLAEAEQAAAREGVTSIRWLHSRAEDVSPDLGSFRLATLGRSFHWMDRDQVLALLYRLLPEGGGVVLAGDGSVWETPSAPFQHATKEVIQRWLGERRRAGGTYFPETLERHEASISRSGFMLEVDYALRFLRTWTIDQVVGHCYSLSFCTPALLGERKAAFEADLRRELGKLEPGEPFEEPAELEGLLLRRR